MTAERSSPKLSSYKIAETFLSINGEGTRAGQLSFFIRFVGCNLQCGYCDTKWANVPEAPHKLLTGDQIYALVRESGSENVTITGGEPMIQPEISPLLELLCRDPALYVEVETNGSVALSQYLSLQNRPAFTMDYKLPSSGMERFMVHENLPLLTEKDTVKFVCGSQEDLVRAKEIIDQYGLSGRTHVYLSPVFGAISPAHMVDFMKENRMVGVNLQLQLHKVIWDPEKRGV
jgi:7-carboxy-7-deazaguanine synthase